MSEEQLIRAAFDAWNEGGPEAFSKLLPPDIEWHAPPQFPDGGVWHDRESLADELHEQFGSVFTPGHVELLDDDAGPRRLAGRRPAERSARRLRACEWMSFMVLQFEDGVPKRVWVFLDREPAMRLAGIDE